MNNYKRAQTIVEYAVIFTVIIAAAVGFIPAARAIFETHFQSAVRSLLS
ncbi:MAG: hypothetical protein Q8L26_03615 [Candidatus Omnitrophota bacterium]|nr:hypothetical protein [Candidatus Omnitrophota bacterium]